LSFFYSPKPPLPCGLTQRLRAVWLGLMFVALAAPCAAAAQTASAESTLPTAKAAKKRPAKPKANTPTLAQREDVQRFIAEMVTRHGFKKEELDFLFSRAKSVPQIVRLMTPSTHPRARSWANYYAGHVDEMRVAGGVNLWNRYPAEMARAEREYGVPPEIIAAIIGIETVYGRVTGTFRVIDALSTLTFDFPRRADFFRGELENYLLFARDEGLDVFEVKGSYAGAIGIPQFMPGSWRRYAVDFDGDGKIDLRNNFVDAIGSVGSFLKQHGWKAGEPIAYPATVHGEEHKLLLQGSFEAKTPVNELEKFGVKAEGAPRNANVLLVDLPTPDQPTSYWVGLENFYVITRYNRSTFYAMSVYDMAQQIKKRKKPG
jgi:membrane-bound lytic murein transglycosylase B